MAGESCGTEYLSTFFGESGIFGLAGLLAVDYLRTEIVWSAVFCCRFAVEGVPICGSLAGS